MRERSQRRRTTVERTGFEDSGLYTEDLRIPSMCKVLSDFVNFDSWQKAKKTNAIGYLRYDEPVLRLTEDQRDKVFLWSVFLSQCPIRYTNEHHSHSSPGRETAPSCLSLTLLIITRKPGIIIDAFAGGALLRAAL